MWKIREKSKISLRGIKYGCYGVMTTPTLVINDKIVSTGKVLSVKEIKKYL